MSDLISKKIAVQGVQELFSMGDCYCDELSIIGMLNGLSPAEPERTAKVIHKQETHIVTPPKSTTTEYETVTNLWTECGNCGAMGMYHGWNYCPVCGVKLDWSDE